MHRIQVNNKKNNTNFKQISFAFAEVHREIGSAPATDFNKYSKRYTRDVL